MQSTNTGLSPPDRIGFDELRRRVRNLARDVVRLTWKWRWVWALGIAGLIAFNSFFMLGINISPSLPERACLIHKREHSLSRGY